MHAIELGTLILAGGLALAPLGCTRNQDNGAASPAAPNMQSPSGANSGATSIPYGGPGDRKGAATGGADVSGVAPGPTGGLVGTQPRGDGGPASGTTQDFPDNPEHKPSSLGSSGGNTAGGSATGGGH